MLGKDIVFVSCVGHCAPDDIVLVPAKAYGTDEKNEEYEVVELLLLLWILGLKEPHHL